MVPHSFQEAQTIARFLAKQGKLVPECYRDQPDHIVVALQLGAEVGLSSMQSLQNIAVIGSRPSIWGDSMLALVQSSGHLQDISECWDKQSLGAVCKVQRRGQSPHTVIYGMEDAQKGGLLNRSFAWKSYPKRMCQMRARGFALRDVFPDVLMGLGSLPLADEYQVRDITESGQVIEGREDSQEEAAAEKAVQPEACDAEEVEDPSAQVALDVIRQQLSRASARSTLESIQETIQKLPQPYFLEGLQAYNDRIAELKRQAQKPAKDTVDPQTGEIMEGPDP